MDAACLIGSGRCCAGAEPQMLRRREGVRVKMTIEGRSVELFPSTRPGAPLVLLNAGHGEGEVVRDQIAAETRAEFSLACIGDIDWDDELTPWPAPSAFSNQPPYGGGADAYLRALTNRVLPQIVETLGVPPRYVALAGYSLAGLFALYAMYRTDAFSRFASASGSVWYPGFVEYALSHAPVRRPDRVYLSVGDREARTRNAAMRPVEESARRLWRAYRAMDMNAAFELNPGGHFDQVTWRIARAVAWLLEDGEARPGTASDARDAIQ